MEGFVGFLVGCGITLLITCQTYHLTLNPNQTVQVLNETCLKNTGIKSARIDFDKFDITCKDGAKFTVKRV